MLRVLLASFLLLTSNAFAQDVNSLDPTKVYDTNNLTTFNQNGSQTTTAWQNVGQWGGQITCWAPGDPGYCGPNPYLNAFGNGSINFSYGLTDLYQVVTIANALPKSGTGLRVNGYNFGFTAKNGNGWDGGGLDTLSAYVNFYGSDGSTVKSDYYNLNYVFNWTDLILVKHSIHLIQQVVQPRLHYGFVGADNNYWAGPYGPEVMNVSFSLKYSVDPCYINKLHSPTCPGYMEELSKLTTTVEKEPAITPTITETPVVATATTAQLTVQSYELLPPTTTKTENKASESSTTSFALSLIQSNRAREQRIESAAVQSANDVATSAIMQTEQTAVSTAMSSLSQSLNIASDSAKTESKEKTNTNNGLTLMSNIATVSDIPSIVQLVPENNQSNNNQLSNNNATNNSLATSSLLNPATVEVPNNSLGLFSKRGDPLTDYIEQNSIMLSMTQPEIKSTTVKKEVQDNDLAGGVKIERMAVTPVGFSVYSLALRDVAFYEPKEIYKNVVIKDNVRTMYFIEKSNTDTYNKMVDAQYK